MVQSKLGGILCVFIFHAITMFFLCPSRHGRAKTVVLWSSAMLFCAVFSFVIVRRLPNFIGMLFAFSIALVLLASTVFFLSRNTVAQTLFLLLTYLQAFMVSVFLSGFFANYFFMGNLDVAIIIRSSLQLGIAVVCILHQKNFDLLSRGISTGWWPLNVLAMLLLSYLSVLTMHAYSTAFTGQTECASIFLLIGVLFAVYFVFFHTIHLMYNSSEKQRAELQSQFLLRQVEMMQESIEEARRIRHDARHHSLQIIEYAQNGDIDALLEYMGEYEKEAERHMAVLYCENLAANSILSAYVRKAEQNGIVVHLDVSMNKDIGISDMDIVAILANVMENAIHGCNQSGKKQKLIDVYIRRKASKLVILVRNTADHNIIFQNGLPKSKQGVGVTSILHSASRYGGETDFKNEEGIFCCQIMLKLPGSNWISV